MYIYMEYVKNVIYGIFGVSHFYMAYVWNKGFHTYIYGVSHFLCGIHMEYVHIYIYMWNMYGIGFLNFIWNANRICMEYVYI